jgi:hypothetical protein
VPVRGYGANVADVSIYLAQIDRLIHELDLGWVERDHNDYRAICAHTC